MSSLLFISLLPFVVSTRDFWITSEVVNVEWKENCLTTRECSLPRFEIAHELKPANLRFVQSTTVSANMAFNRFVSFWSSGSFEDISISVSVMGIDPVYSFPRVCDSTTSNRPFVPADTSSRSRRLSISAGDFKSIRVFARCFTATIEVRKDTERCPWCKEEEMEEKKEERKDSNEMILIAMAVGILLLFITLVSLVLICLCCNQPAGRSPAPSEIVRPKTKTPTNSMTSSGIFSISGSSIGTTVTIHGNPIERDYDSINGDSPSRNPSIDSGFPV